MRPSSHSFGDVNTVAEGALELRAPISVENLGDGPLQVTGTAGGLLGPDGRAVLSLEGAPLALDPGESADLEAVFAAGSGGEFTGWCTVLSDDPGQPAVEVELRGRALAPGIRAAPTALDFGAVVTGNSAELVLKVGNEGFGELELDALRVEGEGFSLLQGNVPVTVAVETQEAMVLQFAPNTVGEHNGTATLSSNDPGAPELVVHLRGTGR